MGPTRDAQPVPEEPARGSLPGAANTAAASSSGHAPPHPALAALQPGRVANAHLARAISGRASGPTVSRVEWLGRSVGGLVDAAREAAAAAAEEATAAMEMAREEGLTDAHREMMRKDAARIGRLLNKQIVWDSDEKSAVGLVKYWASFDHGTGETVFLDEFLRILRGETYEKGTVGTAWIDHHTNAYDEMFEELEDDNLREWKSIIATANKWGGTKRETEGPDNFWGHMAYQEAMGVTGIAKGLSTGLAGMIDAGAWGVTKLLNAAGADLDDPLSFSKVVSEGWDDIGEALYGKDWKEDDLFLGLSAGEIGTGGGEVVWTLTMLGAGAPGGPVAQSGGWAGTGLAALGIAGGLKGVEDSGKKMAAMLVKGFAEGKSFTEIVTSPEFAVEATKMAASIFAATSGAKTASSEVGNQTAAMLARAGILLDSAQATAQAARIAEIGASDLPEKERKEAMGKAVIDLVKTASGIAGAGVQYRIEHGGTATPATDAGDAPKVTTEIEGPVKPAEPGEIVEPAAPKPQPDDGAAAAKPGEPEVVPVPDASDGKSMAGSSKRTDIDDLDVEVGAGPLDEHRAQHEAWTEGMLREGVGGDLDARVQGPMPETLTTPERAAIHYRRELEATGGTIEIGAYRNVETGEYRVVRGDEFGVRGPVVGKWEAVRHFHPNVDPQVLQYRKPAPQDIDTMAMSVIQANRPITEFIDYPLPGGGMGQTAYTLHPDGSVEVRWTRAEGNVEVETYANIGAYSAEYHRPSTYVDPESALHGEMFRDLDEFYGHEPAADTDPTVTQSMAGSAKGGGKPPRSHDLDADVDAAFENLESGAMVQAGARDMTEQTMLDMETLSRLNDEVRELVQGHGVEPPPDTAASLERSEIEIEIAQRILENPTAPPEAVNQALRAIVERAVAEYRARRMTTQGTSHLTAEDLRGDCGVGRDITADAIAAMTIGSEAPVVIHRMQAAELGFGQQHGFSVVVLPDGSRVLVDPTFAQFADQIGGENFSAEPMLSRPDAAGTARDLLTEGLVPLTPETARDYVLGLGAPPEQAEALAARLMADEAATLTEVIVNGEITRAAADPNVIYEDIFEPGDPGAGSIVLTSRLIDRLPENDPARPLLISLRERLISMHELQPTITPKGIGPPPGDGR